MIRIVIPAVILSMVCGCTDLTEYDTSYEAGLYVISAPELAVSAVMGPIGGGRSVCPMAGTIWVATTEGEILSYDTETMQLTNTWKVGQPSSSTYSEMVFSSMENSVYLTGPLGTIIEMDYPSGSIEDDFSLCEAPTMLVVDDDGPFLYCVDAATDMLLEIRLTTNHLSRSCQIYEPALCICNSETRDDTLVIGTMEGTELISAAGAGTLKQWRFDDSVILDAVGIPEDSIHCGVRRSSRGDEIVTLRSFTPDTTGPSHGWAGAALLQGDVHYLSPGTDLVHAYVLSYLGGSISRLVSYDHQNYRIDGSLEIPGYPMDMEMTPSGNLVILTVE